MTGADVNCKGIFVTDESDAQSNDCMAPILKDQVEQDVIVLSTDDCIKDYYQLKQQNMQQLSEPIYTDKGLFIEFCDPSGNRFILMENRDYTAI